MRDSHFLELQGRPLNREWTSYQRGQTHDTFHAKEQGIGADT